MMPIIYYEPNEVWARFLAIRDSGNLECMETLAESEDVVISMTAEKNSDFGDTEILPSFFVDVCGRNSEWEYAVSESDCKATVQELYESYLYPQDHQDDDLGIYGGDEYLMSLIEDREEELTVIFQGFIEEISDVICSFDDAKLNELKDKVLVFLAKNGVEVYRPAIITGKSGEKIYTDYPYEYLV